MSSKERKSILNTYISSRSSSSGSKWQRFNVVLRTTTALSSRNSYRWRSFASFWRSVASCSRLRDNSCFAALNSLRSASMASRLPWHAQWHVTGVISGDAVTFILSELWLADNVSRADRSFPRRLPISYTQLVNLIMLFWQFILFTCFYWEWTQIVNELRMKFNQLSWSVFHCLILLYSVGTKCALSLFTLKWQWLSIFICTLAVKRPDSIIKSCGNAKLVTNEHGTLLRTLSGTD